MPSARYFPADAEVDRWLSSSPVDVDGEAIGRINARLRSDGRIEFAFTPTDGERIEPRARYFPADAHVGRWLRSTEITISVAPATGFSAVSAGQTHSCAIRAGSGAIECWGSNDEGQGDAPAGRFTAVSAGNFHTCAIRESGAIECWGENSDGATGAPPGEFRTVSAGFNHTCGLRESRVIECWGSNQNWQWNEETESMEPVYAGKIDAPPGEFRAVSASGSYTCGLRSNGAIECWGDTDYGQADAPAGSFSAVSAGGFHVCGLRESGAIECWGSNLYGQTDAPTGRFVAVSAGAAHTCAIRESGAIECWGLNTKWQWNEETESAEPVYGGQTDAPAL